jgi:hypothetical protein
LLATTSVQAQPFEDKKFVPSPGGGQLVSFKDALSPGKHEQFRKIVCGHWEAPQGRAACPTFDEMKVVNRRGGLSCHGQIKGVEVLWFDQTPEPGEPNSSGTIWQGGIPSGAFIKLLQPKYRAEFGSNEGCGPPE